MKKATNTDLSAAMTAFMNSRKTVSAAKETWMPVNAVVVSQNFVMA